VPPADFGFTRAGHPTLLAGLPLRVKGGIAYAILEAAAQQSRRTLSDFMCLKALEAAGIEVLGRMVVTIPAEGWEQFEAWIAAPAKALPGTSGTKPGQAHLNSVTRFI